MITWCCVNILKQAGQCFAKRCFVLVTWLSRITKGWEFPTVNSALGITAHHINENPPNNKMLSSQGLLNAWRLTLDIFQLFWHETWPQFIQPVSRCLAENRIWEVFDFLSCSKCSERGTVRKQLIPYIPPDSNSACISFSVSRTKSPGRVWV